MARKVAHAQWHAHVNGVNAPMHLRHWLTDDGSLTRKLVAHSSQFRVRRLRQAHGVCLADERAAVAMPRRRCVQEREVLLHCDGVPVVYAHTIVPLNADAFDWPFFGGLGERSLGTSLFGDPKVKRGTLEYARLHAGHPLVRRARAALNGQEFPAAVFARRCLYRRRQGLLLVTELFLPAIASLAHRAHRA